MGGVNVKNTIVEHILQILAPHPCCGCGRMGGLLCDDCKNDIIHEPYSGCIVCGQPQPLGICYTHNSPIERVFVVSERTETARSLIERLKFHNTKAAAKVLAECMHASLPMLPREAVIVSIPTVRSHIRQRGYDHAALIARYFAHMRELQYDSPLQRKTKTTQHTVNRQTRQLQASHAFLLGTKVSLTGQTIVLVDDIITTASTVMAAANVLKAAGATVWVAACAYQPLD